jgi:asparagine synthase (glutamine-hydrolysing)
MAELVLAHWRAEPSAAKALYDHPTLDRAWLDGVFDGSRSPAPTTVAFLVNLLAAGPQG